MMLDCAIILLAAGNSSRMGRAKQLLEFRGKPLLRHAAEVALSTGCRRVVVVLGSNVEELRDSLAGLEVAIIVNEHWAVGMGTSIKRGIDHVTLSDVGGAILMLADQPFVSPDFLRDLVHRHRETGKPIVASTYSDSVGVPAYFARAIFAQLSDLQPDRGCKALILQRPADVLRVECPEAAIDIDTPADYARWNSDGSAGKIEK